MSSEKRSHSGERGAQGERGDTGSRGETGSLGAIEFRVLEEITGLKAKLDSIQDSQDVFVNSLQDRFSGIDKKLEQINGLLVGNGTPEKGLIVRVDRLEQKNIADLDLRVDRLEQSESRRVWLLRATFVACIGAIIATIASYYKK